MHRQLYSSNIVIGCVCIRDGEKKHRIALKKMIFDNFFCFGSKHGCKKISKLQKTDRDRICQNLQFQALSDRTLLTNSSGKQRSEFHL